MTDLKKTVAIGTSPFIYTFLKKNTLSDVTVFDNGQLEKLGGMWSNVNVEGMTLEFAPHLIELENLNDIDIYEEIFDIKFFIKTNKTFFCFLNKTYDINKKSHRFLLITKRFVFNKSISLNWIKKQKRFLLTNKKFIEPEGGYKKIGNIVESYFKLSNKIVLNKNLVKKIHITNKNINIQTNSGNLQFDSLIITRGISDCEIYYENKKISDLWNKKSTIQNCVVRVLGKVIHNGNYYKFLNEDIDRIARINYSENSSLFVIQKYINPINHDYDPILLKGKIKKIMQDYGIIDSHNIDILYTHYGNSSSFAISDKNFNKLKKMLPTNVQLIDSKAFTPYLTNIMKSRNEIL
jgi:hypothetical protein